MKQTTALKEGQTKLGYLQNGATFRFPGEEQVYEVASFPNNSAYPLMGKRYCLKKGTNDLKGKSFFSNVMVIRIPEDSETCEKS